MTKYTFAGATWRYPEKMSWHFLSLPAEMSIEIREAFQSQEEGWGRLRAMVQIGGSQWATAIWYDTKHETYLLPIKGEIRKREQIELGQTVEAEIWL